MSASKSSSNTAAQANVLWQKQPKANAELFALTYGALVGELVRDLETSELITEELDRMGHSMGIRCIEEFLAKSEATKCTSFAQTADLLKTALRMFLGIVVDTRMNTDKTAATASSSSSAENKNNQDATTTTITNNKPSYSIVFQDNPLTIFVELPETMADLPYNQLLAGMCRGMLELLQYDCQCRIAKSMVNGDETNEIVVTLQQVLQEGAGEDYQEE